MKPALVLTVSIALLSGCASVWEKNYRPISAAESLRGGATPELREVPWERMEAAITDAESRVAESDTHPSEWDEARKLEARGELLRNLQVSIDPERVSVVGVSSFRTTDAVRPWDGRLSEFAGDIGANLIVWSDRYMGKTDAIVDRTVYVDSVGTGYGRAGDDRTRFRTETYSVPVVVAKDERGYTAFFLRVDD